MDYYKQCVWVTGIITAGIVLFTTIVLGAYHLNTLEFRKGGYVEALTPGSQATYWQKPCLSE